jgi:hypothetical protein
MVVLRRRKCIRNRNRGASTSVMDWSQDAMIAMLTLWSVAWITAYLKRSTWWMCACINLRLQAVDLLVLVPPFPVYCWFSCFLARRLRLGNLGSSFQFRFVL